MTRAATRLPAAEFARRGRRALTLLSEAFLRDGPPT